MSIRFTSGGGLLRTANLPPWNAMTICGWASRNTDKGTYTAVSAFSDSTGSMSNGGMYIFGADGDTLGGYTPNNGETAFSPAKTPANDVPFFWAMVISGTGAGAWTLYYREELDGAFTTMTMQGAASSWTPAALWAGENPFGEWLNGSVEHVKCWDAALNSTELGDEFDSDVPVRTSGLNFYWPCSDTTDTNDQSGNGRNPTISGSITNGATLFPFGGGSATLTCDAGSFTLTGGDVSMQEGSAQTGGLVVGSSTSFVGEGYVGAGEASSGSPYTLTCDAGAFTLTGGTVGLKQGYVLPIGAGSFTLTGSDALRDLSMSLAAGSFTLTGQDITLTPSGTPAVLTADAGSFTLTGGAVGLKQGYVLPIAAGSFTLSGQTVGLRAARTLTAAAGSFALTGGAVGLRADRRLAALAGSFTLTGPDVTLTYTPAGANPVMTCDAGSFSLSGQVVSLAAARRLALAAGSFSLSGQAVTLTRSAARLAAEAGSYVIAGGELTFDYSGELPGGGPLVIRARRRRRR